MNNKFITVGIVVKPQGIKGELKVKPLTDDPKKLLSLKSVKISGSDLSVKNTRFAEGFVYFTLEGVSDRNAAELLRNKEISVPKSPDSLSEGEYYVVDLIDADIVIDNNKIGKLKYIDNYGAADVYTIETLDKKEGRFPALKKTILKIDVQNKVIVLDKQSFEDTVTFD